MSTAITELPDKERRRQISNRKEAGAKNRECIEKTVKSTL